MNLRKILSIAIMVCLLATQVASVTWAEETGASADIILTAELDDVIVTLKADKDAFKNEGDLSLAVKPVEIEDTEEEAALDAVEKENVAKRVTYDITVLDGETPIEPVKEVKVSFELKDAPSGADGVNIYHHDEEEGIEKIATQVLKDGAKEETTKVGEAKTEKDIEVREVSEEELADTDDVEIIDDVTVDSFSLYTVDFTYKDKTISIAGDSTGNKLDDIVSQLGIKEEVTEATAYQDEECTEEADNNEVKSSDGETLYSVYEEGDTWYVDAVNAFQTEHGIVVKTADGAEYKIRVTDANPGADPLTFTAKTAGSTVKIVKYGSPDPVTLKYKKGNGSWMTYTVGDEITLDNINDIVSFRGSTTTFSKVDNYYRFVMTGKLEASGSVNSLINNADLSAYCFIYMFQECANLTKAPELPATTLAESCYYYMFYKCKSLTTAPKLPATTLAKRCYDNMFSDCTSLTAAPELPAMTLAERCYDHMFYGCTSLTTAPKLPAMTLAERCYDSMFKTCTSLTAAPELPAMTLAVSCYENMFNWCTSLTTAPELPATTLEESCYYSMFTVCTSLTTVPELPATTLAKYCYYSMFSDCTSLTIAPELPATTLAAFCYNNMFKGCSKLKVSDAGGFKIFTYPNPTSAADTCTNMFSGCKGFSGTPTEGKTYYHLGPVQYSCPEYNTDGDPKSGIKEWDTESADVYTIISDSNMPTTWGAPGAETWYVVHGTADYGTLTNPKTITVLGTAHLILKDGCNLIIKGAQENAVICVTGGSNSLTIYAQSTGADAGKLSAIGSEYADYGGAGIGGGKNQAGSNITINGGTIVATGGEGGAGIGGGRFGEGSNITINGGTVTATGGFGGAGIGGGSGNGGNNITINGGRVTATGGSGGAGIGGGPGDNGRNITINGGEIAAKGGGWAAGIGGGNYGVGSNIHIRNGQVFATGGEYQGSIGSGIGNGCLAPVDASEIFAATDVIVKAGTSANPTTEIIHTATKDIAGDLAGNRYVKTEKSNDPGPTPPGGDEPTTKPTSSGNSSAWTSTPTSMGSASAPISNGSWVNTNGTFTYLIDGEPARNAMVWIAYIAVDGKQYTGCFYFDKDGKMATGWQLIDGVWYCFDSVAGPTQGMMKINCWVEANGKLYYLGADGKMLDNATTPDGKKVGADGALIQ